MLGTRVIPCLLLRNRGLVKTVRFREPSYVGDPINTVRIFNEMEVDELIFLDITASIEGKKPQFKLLEEIANECFMPFAYGGGVRDLNDVRTLFNLGVEKVAINSFAHEDASFIRRVADEFGSQSVVASIDVSHNWMGKRQVVTLGARKKTNLDPVVYARQLEATGAGEILLTSVDRDGTFQGYDLELIRSVAGAVGVPLIACGGAGKLADFSQAVAVGASAVAAGSMFVYQGAHRAVLINYPRKQALQQVLAHV